MRTLLVSFFALVISFGMLVPDAEAKRFGGGFSLGKSFKSPKRVQPAAPSKQQAAPASGTANKAGQPRRSGFGGLMGGLLAGGLLGALFLGGAFDGIQFMDILLIGLLIFVAVKIFAGMKRAQQPQYAGHQREQPETQQQSESETYQNVPPAAGAGFDSEPLSLPEWFNEQAFVEGAKGHFTHLQQAWDRSDWDDIQTYTTPELLETLKQERAQQTADQKTEVVSVMAEMANFIDNDDHVIASVNFYGWLKEDSDETTEFSEIWHLRREMSGDNSDWVIVGIQQP